MAASLSPEIKRATATGLAFGGIDHFYWRVPAGTSLWERMAQSGGSSYTAFAGRGQATKMVPQLAKITPESRQIVLSAAAYLALDYFTKVDGRSWMLKGIQQGGSDAAGGYAITLV